VVPAPADRVVVAHVAFIVFVAVDSLLAGTLSVDELDLRRRHRPGHCRRSRARRGECGVAEVHDGVLDARGEVAELGAGAGPRTCGPEDLPVAAQYSAIVKFSPLVEKLRWSCPAGREPHSGWPTAAPALGVGGEFDDVAKTDRGCGPLR
jgi:hypothetical protein